MCDRCPLPRAYPGPEVAARAMLAVWVLSAPPGAAREWRLRQLLEGTTLEAGDRLIDDVAEVEAMVRRRARGED